MNRPFHYLIVDLFLLPVVAATGKTAESQTAVKVALADMSSAMGMGPAGQGYGMMGPGMMGRGMMGHGMMGPGMGGMMGSMMAVRTDHSSVKTGTIHFDVAKLVSGRSA